MPHDPGLSKYRFPVVRSAFPASEEWLPYLEESYAQNLFTNFGPVVTRFETALTVEFGEKDDAFIAVSSATAGLAACLIAEGVNGVVLVPAFTFPASAAAVRMAGAEPMLIDVDPVTWACDAQKLGRALDRTGAEAVMLVAPFGICQDFSAHVALCRSRGVRVVIDNAAGLGGGPQSRRTLRGDAYEVYSLHATKPFGIGEGGAVQTTAERAGAVRAAINFGFPYSAEHRGRWGINGKMSEFAAAVGMAVLAGYDDVLAVRRRQVSSYIELFARFGDIMIQHAVADAPWHVFPCLLPTPAAASDLPPRPGVTGSKYAVITGRACRNGVGSPLPRNAPSRKCWPNG